jgi:Leucine-rich repeat (LRR) protein
MYNILNIAGNKLNRITGIGMLEKLEYLNMSNNNIPKIENLYAMSNLKALYLSTTISR